MPINSISPSQPAQSIQAVKKNEVDSSRKRAEIQEEDKVKSRKDTVEHNAQVQKSQQAQSNPNEGGRKIGTVINVTA